MQTGPDYLHTRLDHAFDGLKCSIWCAYDVIMWRATLLYYSLFWEVNDAFRLDREQYLLPFIPRMPGRDPSAERHAKEEPLIPCLLTRGFESFQMHVAIGNYHP